MIQEPAFSSAKYRILDCSQKKLTPILDLECDHLASVFANNNTLCTAQANSLYIINPLKKTLEATIIVENKVKSFMFTMNCAFLLICDDSLTIHLLHIATNQQILAQQFASAPILYIFKLDDFENLVICADNLIKIWRFIDTETLDYAICNIDLALVNETRSLIKTLSLEMPSTVLDFMDVKVGSCTMFLVLLTDSVLVYNEAFEKVDQFQALQVKKLIKIPGNKYFLMHSSDGSLACVNLGRWIQLSTVPNVTHIQVQSANLISVYRECIEFYSLPTFELQDSVNVDNFSGFISNFENTDIKMHGFAAIITKDANYNLGLISNVSQESYLKHLISQCEFEMAQKFANDHDLPESMVLRAEIEYNIECGNLDKALDHLKVINESESLRQKCLQVAKTDFKVASLVLPKLELDDEINRKLATFELLENIEWSQFVECSIEESLLSLVSVQDFKSCLVLLSKHQIDCDTYISRILSIIKEPLDAIEFLQKLATFQSQSTYQTFVKWIENEVRRLESSLNDPKKALQLLSVLLVESSRLTPMQQIKAIQKSAFDHPAVSLLRKQLQDLIFLHETIDLKLQLEEYSVLSPEQVVFEYFDRISLNELLFESDNLQLLIEFYKLNRTDTLFNYCQVLLQDYNEAIEERLMHVLKELPLKEELNVFYEMMKKVTVPWTEEFEEKLNELSLCDCSNIERALISDFNTQKKLLKIKKILLKHQLHANVGNRLEMRKILNQIIRIDWFDAQMINESLNLYDYDTILLKRMQFQVETGEVPEMECSSMVLSNFALWLIHKIEFDQKLLYYKALECAINTTTQLYLPFDREWLSKQAQVLVYLAERGMFFTFEECKCKSYLLKIRGWDVYDHVASLLGLREEATFEYCMNSGIDEAIPIVSKYCKLHHGKSTGLLSLKFVKKIVESIDLDAFEKYSRDLIEICAFALVETRMSESIDLFNLVYFLSRVLESTETGASQMLESANTSAGQLCIQLFKKRFRDIGIVMPRQVLESAFVFVNQLMSNDFDSSLELRDTLLLNRYNTLGLFHLHLVNSFNLFSEYQSMDKIEMQEFLLNSNRESNRLVHQLLQFNLTNKCIDPNFSFYLMNCAGYETASQSFRHAVNLTKSDTERLLDLTRVGIQYGKRIEHPSFLSDCERLYKNSLWTVDDEPHLHLSRVLTDYNGNIEKLEEFCHDFEINLDLAYSEWLLYASNCTVSEMRRLFDLYFDKVVNSFTDQQERDELIMNQLLVGMNPFAYSCILDLFYLFQDQDFAKQGIAVLEILQDYTRQSKPELIELLFNAPNSSLEQLMEKFPESVERLSFQYLCNDPWTIMLKEISTDSFEYLFRLCKPLELDTDDLVEALVQKIAQSRESSKDSINEYISLIRSAERKVSVCLELAQNHQEIKLEMLLRAVDETREFIASSNDQDLVAKAKRNLPRLERMLFSAQVYSVAPSFGSLEPEELMKQVLLSGTEQQTIELASMFNLDLLNFKTEYINELLQTELVVTDELPSSIVIASSRDILESVETICNSMKNSEFIQVLLSIATRQSSKTSSVSRLRALHLLFRLVSLEEFSRRKIDYFELSSYFQSLFYLIDFENLMIYQTIKGFEKCDKLAFCKSLLVNASVNDVLVHRLVVNICIDYSVWSLDLWAVLVNRFIESRDLVLYELPVWETVLKLKKELIDQLFQVAFQSLNERFVRESALHVADKLGFVQHLITQTSGYLQFQQSIIR